MNIGHEIARKGKKYKMCKEYLEQVKIESDKEKLVGLYISPKGLEFCLKKDFPTLDYIRETFTGIAGQFGVKIDEAIKAVNEKKLVMLGTCEGVVTINQFTISELFLKHDSEVVLLTRDNSFVTVEMYDNSKLSIISSGNSKVHVSRYGGKVTFESNDNSVVKIIDKTLEL